MRLRIHQEQRHALAFAGAACAARRNNYEVGHMAVDHERLGPVELEAVAGAHRLHVGLQRTMLCGLIDRKRCDQLARRDLWQIFAPLRLAAAARERRRREHCGRQEWRRRQVAADLLHHHAGLDAAESAAAEFFRYQQAGKAHLGERLPQFARKAGRVAAVAQVSQMRNRRLVADEPACGVAEHGLFFGEDEGHGRVPNACVCSIT
jgi:hypothetical protein